MHRSSGHSQQSTLTMACRRAVFRYASTPEGRCLFKIKAAESPEDLQWRICEVTGTHNHVTSMTTNDLASWTTTSTRVPRRRGRSDEPESDTHRRLSPSYTPSSRCSSSTATTSSTVQPPSVASLETRQFEPSHLSGKSPMVSDYSPSYVSFVRSFESSRASIDETLGSLSRIGIGSLETLISALLMKPLTLVKLRDQLKNRPEDASVVEKVERMANALRVELMGSTT